MALGALGALGPVGRCSELLGARRMAGEPKENCFDAADGDAAGRAA